MDELGPIGAGECDYVLTCGGSSKWHDHQPRDVQCSRFLCRRAQAHNGEPTRRLGREAGNLGLAHTMAGCVASFGDSILGCFWPDQRGTD